MKSISNTSVEVRAFYRNLKPSMRRPILILLLLILVPFILIPFSMMKPKRIKSKHSYSHSYNSKSWSFNQKQSFREKRYSSVFYYKTHKTASTTISSTLIKYARRHKLSPHYAPGRIYMNFPNKSGKKYDMIALQHMPFSYKLLDTYLKTRPKLIITSIRKPVSRAISWFRQQNKDVASIEDDQCKESNKNKLLEKFDEFVKAGHVQESQMLQLQETTLKQSKSSGYLTLNETIDQFHFIFLKERLKESFECFCKDYGVRLCDKRHPLKMKNAKHTRECVENVLMENRLEKLSIGLQNDTMLFDRVEKKLNACQLDGIPEFCRCHTEY